MELTAVAHAPFELDELAEENPLVQAATLLTEHYDDQRAPGELIVVIRPATDAIVVSGSLTSILRAAVSVAVAAGNDRLWRDAPVGNTHEVSTASMPEIISSAAVAAGVGIAHVGLGCSDDRIEAITIWFERDAGVAPRAERHMVLNTLCEAANRLSEIDAARAASEPEPVSEEPTGRVVDLGDPTLDPATGLLTAEHFREMIEAYDHSEASVMVVDLGDEVDDGTTRRLADVFVEPFGHEATLARIARTRFAAVSSEIPRNEMIRHGQRLIESLAAVCPDGQCTAPSVALAHEVGLVDVEEMLETAVQAAEASRRSGGGRLVLAS